MTLSELLRRLAIDQDDRVAAGNLALIIDLLARGYEAHKAEHHPAGGPFAQPTLLVVLVRDGERLELTTPIDGGLRRLADRLPQLQVASPLDPLAEAPAAPSLASRLGELFRRTSKLEPEQRAVRLMDWVMDQIEASRCALIPFESGSAEAPLVHHLRGARPGSLDIRDVPRRVVASVARTRQPRVRHVVGAADDDLPGDETAIRQQVTSYMAVPVVFRGELLAVCYVDRFDKPRRFTDDEQAMFEAFAYELATPLLELRAERRRHEYRALRDQLLAERPESLGLTSGAALEEVLERARRLAPFPAENLLILGETGVGKEVVARYIHEHSDRPRSPFVAVNVSALSAELFESELMGSVRGAFTGAVDRQGRILDAEGGTLFLDEIGDLALTNQVKLLRFLSDKMVTPVGGRTRKAADVRILAATNRSLEELVRVGEFREDLFHRFAPPLVVPPLRARTDEIVPHAQTWLRLKARQAGIPEPELDDEAEAFLLSYAWPGNVRQLEAVISHAVLLANRRRIGRRLLASLVPTDGPEAATDATPTTWEDYRAQRETRERAWLVEMLRRNDDRLAETARAIDAPLSTLRSLLKRHGLRG